METPILMSRENPTGATLESVLGQLIAELKVKTDRILNDECEASKVIVKHNLQIIGNLQESLDLQKASMKMLDAVFGRNTDPTTPRIGKDK